MMVALAADFGDLRVTVRTFIVNKYDLRRVLMFVMMILRTNIMY